MLAVRLGGGGGGMGGGGRVAWRAASRWRWRRWTRGAVGGGARLGGAGDAGDFFFLVILAGFLFGFISEFFWVVGTRRRSQG